ncbi:MAG: hypothetical protein RRY64_00655 [Oscillospiraceae bacterium]
MKKSMKKFVIGTLTASLTLLCAGALMVAILDPFFRLAPPGDREIYSNERYENPGMIRNLDYDTAVLGTSLVCNYRASWFGDSAVKISYRDGYFSEFDTALDLTFRTHPDLSKVYFGLDLNILTRDESQRTAVLEPYLYNDNPLDDVAYFLNMEVYLRCANLLVRRMNGTTTALDDAYVWDGTCEFSRAAALAHYIRPPVGTPLPPEQYYAACDQNLAVLDRWLTDHRDTEFTFFISPYSILYWDYAMREGSVDAKLSALSRTVEHLQGHPNLRLIFLMDQEQMMTNLDHYTDYIHCDGSVSQLLATQVQGDEFLLTAENYKDVLAHFSDLIKHYDYEAIFATP